ERDAPSRTSLAIWPGHADWHTLCRPVAPGNTSRHYRRNSAIVVVNYRQRGGSDGAGESWPARPVETDERGGRAGGDGAVSRRNGRPGAGGHPGGGPIRHAAFWQAAGGGRARPGDGHRRVKLPDYGPGV